MSCAYSPELKAPARVPEIDPSKPAMAGMLKILVLTHRRQTSAFAAPEGLSVRRIEVPRGESENVPCLIVEREGQEALLPGILMIHGGAFYLPLQTTALELACVYARELNARIVLPDYSLVPQSTAPSQLEDCLAVWNMLSEDGTSLGIDKDRRLVMGDSAGATLAAGLCLWLRDQGLPQPKGQLLIYPVLDDREEAYASYRLYAEAAWPAESNRAMWRAYLKDAEEEMLPYLVPMRARSLKGLPRAYVEPQEIDVLRDEGIAFAKTLSEAGVETELNIVAGSYHGFDSDLTSTLVQRVVCERVRIAKKWINL